MSGRLLPRILSVPKRYASPLLSPVPKLRTGIVTSLPPWVSCGILSLKAERACQNPDWANSDVFRQLGFLAYIEKSVGVELERESDLLPVLLWLLNTWTSKRPS
jgi:hypothetical protein